MLTIESTSHLLLVPQDVFDNMLAGIELIEHHGYSVVLPGCDYVLGQLPSISLQFSTGELQLTPEDYTRPLGDGTCELLVNSFDQGDASVWIDFLQMKELNLRMSANEYLICDSLDV